MASIVAFSKALYREVQRDDVSGAAAELAYRFLFALFPFLLFLVTLSGFVADWLGVDNPSQELLEEIGTALPGDARSVLQTQLDRMFEDGNAGLLSVAILGALWAASGGMKSLVKAMNRAYGVQESRSFFHQQVLGVGLTLLGGLTFIAAAVLLVVGQIVGEAAADAIGFEGVWTLVVSLARIPVALVVLLLATAFLYWFAPNANLPFRWVTPGAVMFTLVWLVATMGFAFYVANFGSYASTYGAVGGVIILMTWLYITSFVLLVGVEINALLQARAETTDTLPLKDERVASPS